MPAKRVILLDLVCLQAEHLKDESITPTLSRLAREGWSAPLTPPFPAVTSTVQATLFTGTTPREHGVVSNGLYERDRFTVRFWDQPIGLAKPEKLWERLRRADENAKTALLFFPNTSYASADVVVTPAPLTEEGDLVPWCYSKPVGTYERLAEQLEPFDPSSYWGPLADQSAPEWIARAAVEVAKEHDPTLMAVYLPLIDYDSQRYGPDSAQVQDDLIVLDRLVGTLLEDLRAAGRLDDTAVILLSEYAISAVSRPVYLNRLLREAGLLTVREINGHEYLDFELSRAFAMVDHQIAHLYLKEEARGEVHAAIWGKPGVDKLLYDLEKSELSIDHERSGELIAIAEADAWFPYYWWLDDEKAPPFARAVDLFRKPGYDPLELIFDPMARSVPLDATLLRGSHGLPADRDPKRPLLIAHGAAIPRQPPGEVPLAKVPDLVMGLLGHRDAPASSS